MVNDIFKGNEILVFGHRGYSEIAPENTLASFDLCRRLGIPGIELDVHICSTGQVVVSHDFSMKRTTGVDCLIEQTSLEELKKLDIGSFKGAQYSDQRILLLDELFEEFGDCFVYDIELKSNSITDNSELAQKTLEIICAHKLQHRVVISSFNPFSLRAFNHCCKRSISTADIFAVDDGVPKVLQKGFGRHISRSSFLKPEYHQINERFMHKYNTLLGYPVVSWTINDSETAQLLIALGINGLIGNNPEMLIHCVRKTQPKQETLNEK